MPVRVWQCPYRRHGSAGAVPGLHGVTERGDGTSMSVPIPWCPHQGAVKVLVEAGVGGSQGSEQAPKHPRASVASCKLMPNCHSCLLGYSQMFGAYPKCVMALGVQSTSVPGPPVQTMARLLKKWRWGGGLGPQPQPHPGCFFQPVHPNTSVVLAFSRLLQLQEPVSPRALRDSPCCNPSRSGNRANTEEEAAPSARQPQFTINPCPCCKQSPSGCQRSAAGGGEASNTRLR